MAAYAYPVRLATLVSAASPVAQTLRYAPADVAALLATLAYTAPNALAYPAYYPGLAAGVAPGAGVPDGYYVAVGGGVYAVCLVNLTVSYAPAPRGGAVAGAVNYAANAELAAGAPWVVVAGDGPPVGGALAAAAGPDA